MKAPLARPSLDTLQIAAGGEPVLLACPSHSKSGTTALYQDGVVRLLCTACGFEAMKIKVEP